MIASEAKLPKVTERSKVLVLHTCGIQIKSPKYLKIIIENFSRINIHLFLNLFLR